VIRALNEAGIAIDVLGGTSAGALIAAQCALEWPTEEILRRSREAWDIPRGLRSYAPPLVSLFDGRWAAEIFRRVLGDVRLEDLWKRFYCVSTNLTRSELAVHERGPAWQAIAMSSALPGAFPPVFGGGELHVDGGILDNLPAGVMEQWRPGRLMLVDVGQYFDLRPPDGHATCPSGWTLLRRRLMRDPIAMPGIFEIIYACTTLAATRAAQSFPAGAIVLRPPVEGFRTLEFTRSAEIAECGYHYARAAVEEAVAKWSAPRAGGTAAD